MTELKTSDFDYHLPQELIAQTPSQKRDHSRLMVLHRKTKTIEHKLFKDVIDYLLPGDVLVINDTKVIPANIIGRKEDGTAKIEVLLVRKKQENIWTCLVKPGKRLKVGSFIIFSDNLKGRVLEKLETGEQVIEFFGDLYAYSHEHGEIPLPPYIHKNPKLSERYQTVYAANEGASAAPTAGLHFTPELLAAISAKGIDIRKITLHTGLGTFKPVYADYIRDHKMFSEEYAVTQNTMDAINNAKRVVAVGTTSVRTLETIARGGELVGSTDIFIYPGFKFELVNCMITNFHVPRSTLMMLVSAFAGRDFIFQAYKEAIEKEYRFFSFGDAMIII